MKKKFLLTDLFDTYAQFCHCAPGADTSSDFDSLQGSAVAARKRIVTIIGEEVFALIVTMDNEDVVKSFLQTAMANLTLATQIAFDAVNRRKPPDLSLSARESKIHAIIVYTAEEQIYSRARRQRHNAYRPT